MLRAANRPAIRSYCDLDRKYKDRLHGYSLARQIRHWAIVDTHLIHNMFPDVIMVATPSSEREAPLHSNVPLLAALEQHLPGGRYYADSLITHPYKNKAVLAVAAATRESNAVIKVANVRLPGAELVQQSYQKLQRLHSSFQATDPRLTDTIPSPMAVVRVGSLVATMETAARGSRLIDLVLERRYFDRRERVRRHLELITSWLVASKPALAALGSDGLLDPIPAEWLVAPNRDTEARLGSALRCFGVAQHGDFYPENVFLAEESEHITVIDWDTCAAGYPPLFDWFCLVTGLYYTHQAVRGLPRGQTVEPISFRQTYFEVSWFSELIVSLSHRLCDRLGLDRAGLLDYFRLFIVVRYQQFCAQAQLAEKHYWGPLNMDLYQEHYHLLLTNPKECCFWTPRASRLF
jgi:hypothetical protein